MTISHLAGGIIAQSTRLSKDDNQVADYKLVNYAI